MPVTMPDFENRLVTYSEEHCWQYDIRLRNLHEDLEEANMSIEEMESLRVKDFEFRFVEDKKERKKLTQFIKRHEWLGTLSLYTTHWFGAYYKDKLAGVVLMNMPNAFSKLLGDDTKNLERLISRGACISWSPKTLASCLLMWCIDYMVRNTQYRLFTCYSDPTAREIGTIYQACSFLYIGQGAGAVDRYVNPYTGKLVSDRFFRQKTAYKKYAEELGISWQKNWSHPKGMCWENIPEDIALRLREAGRQKQKEAERVSMPSKHKYLYIKGRDKRETKKLRSMLSAKPLPYPKNRNSALPVEWNVPQSSNPIVNYYEA